MQSSKCCVRTRFEVSRTSPRAPEGSREGRREVGREGRRERKREGGGKALWATSSPLAHANKPLSSVSALQDLRTRDEKPEALSRFFISRLSHQCSPPTPQNGTWRTTLLPACPSVCVWAVLHNTGSSCPHQNAISQEPQHCSGFLLRMCLLLPGLTCLPDLWKQ